MLELAHIKMYYYGIVNISFIYSILVNDFMPPSVIHISFGDKLMNFNTLKIIVFL